MAKEKKDYGVTFRCFNFKASQIEDKEIWEEMKDEYVVLLNDFNAAYNSEEKTLNEQWKEAHKHDEELSESDKEIERLEYGIYLHDTLNAIAYIISQGHPEIYYLDPFVFYGSKGPQFGCRIRQYPEGWISHYDKKKE